MEITRKIVKQPFAPDTTDVLWLDSSGDSDVLKSFYNGQWKEVAGASGSLEPLVVEGVYNGETFIPSAGQSSFAEAFNAFMSGKRVYMKSDNNLHTVDVITCTGDSTNGLLLGVRVNGQKLGWSFGDDSGDDSDNENPNPNK